jgi:predicted ester cyclase
MPTKEFVLADLYDAYNKRDVERMRSMFTEDAVYFSPADGFRREGIDAIMEYTEQNLWVPFPDSRSIVHKEVATANTVVAQVTIEGTQTGPFSRVTDDCGIAELPPTNKSVVGHAVEWLTINDDGLITMDEIYFDRMELMIQLGLMPGA